MNLRFTVGGWIDSRWPKQFPLRAPAARPMDEPVTSELGQLAGVVRCV